MGKRNISRLRTPAGPRKKYTCLGGPWHGEALALTRVDPTTIVFQVKGWPPGRYVMQGGNLTWEERL